MASKSYTGWNTYDINSKQPIKSRGYSNYNPGGNQTVSTGMGYNPWGMPISQAPSGRLSAQTTRSSGGGGGGGFMGAGGSVYDDSQDLGFQLQIADWQQRANEASRAAALGEFGTASGYSGRLSADPYGEPQIGLMQGEQRDLLNAQRNAQLRKLQDTMSRRGGAVGYGMENELAARYQKNLSEAMRNIRIQAIDKNRRALEQAMALETNLAANKARMYERFPVAVDLPTFSQPQQASGGLMYSYGGTPSSDYNAGRMTGRKGIGIR